jgi:hypothetical protein
MARSVAKAPEEGSVDVQILKCAPSFLFSCEGGNDDDIFGSSESNGEVDIGSSVQCRGGLCAASRLLFGRTVFAFGLTRSIYREKQRIFVREESK